MQRIANPIEWTTAVTDAGLALVATGGLGYLQCLGASQTWKVNLWSGALGGIALSGLLGFLAHGFVLSAATHHRVWQLLNLTLGLAVSLFVVGVAYDLGGPETARRLLPAMLALAFGFFLVTQMFPGIFFIFIGYEATALVFALGAYGWLAFNARLNGAVLMAAGVLFSSMAAVIQLNKRICLTLIWRFDHNGLFHLVQIIGLLVLLVGLGASLQPP
ncbi:MAG: hypothetical protein JSW39_01030 [Desulfobacterales bacterium]|nr:MAG: hypothetical protein JSW39_01030 [Desulfobacterales bacterium]